MVPITTSEFGPVSVTGMFGSGFVPSVTVTANGADGEGEDDVRRGAGATVMPDAVAVAAPSVATTA